MAGNVHKGTSKDIFTGKGNAVVGQDKDAQPRISAGTSEPRIPQVPANMHATPSKRHGSQKRQTVEIGVCLSPQVKAELERLRDQGGGKPKLSLSKVAAAFIEQGVQGHIDMQYGALLRPVIEQAIAARFRARDARFVALLVRMAHDAGQTRSLVTNLLARAPGVTPDLLETILDRSAERSKANLTHLSPQITELIQAVEQWMGEAAKEGRVVT